MPHLLGNAFKILVHIFTILAHFSFLASSTLDHVTMSRFSLPAGPLLKHPIWCGAPRIHWRPIVTSTVDPTLRYTSPQPSSSLIHIATLAFAWWGKTKEDKWRRGFNGQRWLLTLRHGVAVWFTMRLVTFEVCLIGTKRKGSRFSDLASLGRDGNWERVASAEASAAWVSFPGKGFWSIT